MHDKSFIFELNCLLQQLSLMLTQVNSKMKNNDVWNKSNHDVQFFFIFAFLLMCWINLSRGQLLSPWNLVFNLCIKFIIVSQHIYYRHSSTRQRFDAYQQLRALLHSKCKIKRFFFDFKQHIYIWVVVSFLSDCLGSLIGNR